MNDDELSRAMFGGASHHASCRYSDMRLVWICDQCGAQVNDTTTLHQLESALEMVGRLTSDLTAARAKLDKVQNELDEFLMMPIPRSVVITALQERLATVRRDTLEEAARVVEEMPRMVPNSQFTPLYAAGLIRALSTAIAEPAGDTTKGAG